jgi:hypothetical protein
LFFTALYCVYLGIMVMWMIAYSLNERRRNVYFTKVLAVMTRATHDMFFMSGATLVISASQCTDTNVLRGNHEVVCDDGLEHRANVASWQFLQVFAVFGFSTFFNIKVSRAGGGRHEGDVRARHPHLLRTWGLLREERVGGGARGRD